MTNVTVVKKPKNTSSNNQPAMQIRTQKYAQIAYPLVEAIQGHEIEAKYRTLALNFPTMILQSGLAQAIGFLMAKDKQEHKVLLSHIVVLVNKNESPDMNQMCLKQTDDIKKMTKNFHDKVVDSNITDYQLYTRKAIEASSWLKRYTQALLKKEGEIS